MLKKVDQVLCLFEDTVLVIGILSGAILLFINVVLKQFGGSIVWAEEYTKFAIIWITFAGCGAAVRCNAHMKISALYDICPANIKRILDTLVNVIGIAFSVFLVIYGAQLTDTVRVTKQMTPSMGIPMWWIYMSVPIGGVLMIIRFVQVTINLYRPEKEMDK